MGARCINSDPFWPSIDLDNLRQQLQIPPAISDARLEVAAIGAVIRVNREFGQWRRGLKLKGYNCLEQLRAEPEDETPVLVRCYLKAVAAQTALELESHFRETDQRLRCHDGRIDATRKKGKKGDNGHG
ncbi:head completion/stabilization protein [Pseudomonas sp. R5(2019)]|uniref:head completion/stabilization protein n=1 Tax=Pseudomonas sp. R5(2019) TaxID=2697566 RepID=UPI00353256C2